MSHKISVTFTSISTAMQVVTLIRAVQTDVQVGHKIRDNTL